MRNSANSVYKRHRRSVSIF